MTPNTTRALAWQFAHIAGQYYVAARFSALAGSVPVSANLMHYAFEFLLKAFVLKRVRACQSAASADGKLRDDGHSLEALWAGVTRIEPGLNDPRFEEAIKGLDPWWDVRYPTPAGRVMTVTFAPGPPAIGGPDSGPVYVMDVPILDECFHRVWMAASMDGVALTNATNESNGVWRLAYEQNNQFQF